MLQVATRTVTNLSPGDYEPRDALLRRSSPQFTFKGVDPKVVGGSVSYHISYNA